MASISSNDRGYRRILWVDNNPGSTNHHPQIRLGKITMRNAEGIRLKVEDLVQARANSSAPLEETSRWLTKIDATLYGKLAAVGLVANVTVTTIGELIAAWMERRSKSLKPATLVRLEQSKKSMIGYFTAGRGINTVTDGDAGDYRAALLAQGLAEATTRKRCSDARMWFSYAVRHRLASANPFESVPTAPTATAHLSHVSEENARKVLAEITNPDLRLIFVLARWGGLRTVSEPKALRWDGIDILDKMRIVVHSPKTEGHAGHEQRIIPAFPELVGELQAAYERLPEGAPVLVLPVLQRIAASALRKPILRAIKAAGVTPWPRLWHNLRASRQTDLEQRFPGHVVAGWMGNSAAVAAKHYLMTLDGDFDRATKGDAPANPPAEAAHRAAHKAAQPTPASPCPVPTSVEAENEKTPVKQGFSRQKCGRQELNLHGVFSPTRTRTTPGNSGESWEFTGGGAQDGARPATLHAGPEIVAHVSREVQALAAALWQGGVA